MKICQICVGYPPKKGGCETHNYTLVNHLLKRGYEVDVIVMRDITSDRLDELYGSSPCPSNVCEVFPKNPFFWNYQLRREIKKIDKKRKIDVFDIHRSYHMIPFLFDSRKKILSLHFLELTCPLHVWPRPCENRSFSNCTECTSSYRYFYWKIIRNIAIKKSDAIVVKYNYLKNLLIRDGIDENKIKLIPHWIDVDKINRDSKKSSSIKGVEKDDIVFTFFGRLSEEKGVDTLIKAFERINEEYIKSKLIIIGNGPSEKKLKKIVEDRDISKRVIFKDFIPHAELFKELSLTDCFVFPHRYFNYEWALLEAMSTEKTIIATDVAATRDILKHKENALLAKPEEKAISKQMKYFIENRNKCRKTAKNAYYVVKTKHSNDNLNNYEEIINSL